MDIFLENLEISENAYILEFWEYFLKQRKNDNSEQILKTCTFFNFQNHILKPRTILKS